MLKEAIELFAIVMVFAAFAFACIGNSVLYQALKARGLEVSSWLAGTSIHPLMVYWRHRKQIDSKWVHGAALTSALGLVLMGPTMLFFGWVFPAAWSR